MSPLALPDPTCTPEPTNRRAFLKLSGSALAAAGLAACGGASAASTRGTTTVSLWMNPLWSPWIHTQLAQWSRQNRIDVKITPVPNDTDAYFAKIRTILEAGSSDVDVFAGDVSWPPQLGSNGWLTDLTKLYTPALQAPFLPATVQSNIWNGKVYGVPFFTDVGLIYYRKDLLERAGYSEPPQTWPQLQEMALKIMRDQHVPNGFVFTGDVYEGGTLLGVEFILTCGGKVIDGRTVTANSPQAIEGLALERSMVTKGISPQAVATWQEPQVEAAFLSGKAPFCRQWSYVFDDIPNKKISSISPSQVGVTGIPRLTTAIPPVNVGGGWNIYVNAASKHQGADWKLVEFLTSDPIQLILANNGLPPVRSALYNDAELLKTQPYASEAKQEIAQTITPPKSPFYSDMSALMAEQFNKNLRGVISPAQAAEAVQTGLESIVKRGGTA
jgi:multiple sugar transport system substrate-binding protein